MKKLEIVQDFDGVYFNLYSDDGSLIVSATSFSDLQSYNIKFAGFLPYEDVNGDDSVKLAVEYLSIRR